MKHRPPCPEHVDIGPLRFRITRDEIDHKLAEHGSRSSLMGQTNPSTLTIVVAPGLHPRVARQTLVHEILHALIYASGYRPDEDKRGEGHEERIVSAIETPLYAVLRDNPGVLAWLLSDKD